MISHEIFYFVCLFFFHFFFVQVLAFIKWNIELDIGIRFLFSVLFSSLGVKTIIRYSLLITIRSVISSFM